MAKLIELQRDEFLTEISDNWSKWKAPTTVKELVKYMQDNAFSKKAVGTLEKLTKEQLRNIILNGDDETVTEEKKSVKSAGLGADIVDFLEEMKIEIHKQSFNPFVRKQIIKQIDKQAEKIEDESIFDKLGVFSMVVFGVLLVLEMLLPNGFKDIVKKYKEYKANQIIDVEVAE